MSYPDKIIEEIKKKYPLSSDNLQQLKETLLTDEVKTAIENSTFNTEYLLIKMDDNPSNLFICSSIAAKEIIASPSLLKELKEYISVNLDAMRKWNNLKSEISKLTKLSFSHANLTEKRNLAVKILALVAPLAKFLTSNEILNKEYDYFSPVLIQYLNSSVEIMEDISRSYFENLFKKEEKEIIEISFSPKNVGVQLGTKINITYREKIKSNSSSLEKKQSNKIITYHIKTHQEGSGRHSSSAKPVDPKELFVYKLLEFMGYGPKTHFFFNMLSPGGFFIATQDLSFTKIEHKRKHFSLFEEKKENCNSDPGAPRYEEARKAMIGLDIISRILRLRDTTTNPGNFGLVTVNDVKNKWKILDFRVFDDPEYYAIPHIMKGFKEGNGAFNYSYSDFMFYIFKNEGYQATRMALSQQVIDELTQGKRSENGKKMPFMEAVDKAHQEIIDYFTTNQNLLRINSQTALTDLAQYTQAIKENFITLARGINEVNSVSITLAAASPSLITLKNN